jgi:eukaryotic-like serine/threonine-protein kinase
MCRDTVHEHAVGKDARLLSLAPGTRLGRYEISELLGAGGMGEVYQARDTSLARVVAVKVLPATFATDRERLKRFEHEARAAAALNHPGVMAVYDLGLHEGSPYLVTELLEGVSLRQKLASERLAVPKAIGYGAQIAQALAAAHEKGIVHRDLKPDNLFITANDRVKILDFGLAKLMAPGDMNASIADATGTVHAVLGTIGYMAPEQARGLPTDHRADIFSFGCVLFEMLQGQRAFGRDSPADTFSAILKEPAPELTSSPEQPVPPALHDIVRRCLEKDPPSRFQSSSDLAFALKSLTQVTEVLPAPAKAHELSPPPQPAPVRQGRWIWAAGAAAAVLAGLLGLLIGRSSAPANRPIVAEFLVPPPSFDASFAPMPLPGLAPTAPQVGLSPDGRMLAFVLADPAGARKLWIRSLDTGVPRAIAGTDGVSSWPFWSPDSRFVVFAANRALMKLDVTAGTVERFLRLPEEAPAVPFVTGSWGSDGTILFSIGGPSGLYRVAASGGTPVALTKLDGARSDNYHSWPQHLPGGRFLLYVRTDDAKTNGVYAGRLDSTEITQVLPSASRAVFAGGQLLWSIEERVVAQPFDPASLRLGGESTTLVPAVYQGAGRTPAFWASDSTLAYAVAGSRERNFRWFDRAGAAQDSVGAPGLYNSFDLIPDGSRVVIEVMKEGPPTHTTLSMLDTARGVITPLTLGEQNDNDPRFGPNGEVVFARNSPSGPGLVQLDKAGANPTILMARGKLPVLWLEDWAADGRSLIFRSGADRDAWQVGTSGNDAKRLTQAKEPLEQVQLSPDSRWFAYNTADSGRSEVYVSPVGAGSRRWQLSSDGGVQPIWRADGRELYYLGLDAGLYAVNIRPDGDEIQAERPRLLFRTPLPVISAVVEQYRVTGDGQRFLFCLPLTSVQREPLRMLLNWPDKLARSRGARQ